MPNNTRETRSLHDKWVHAIARQRMNFPNAQHPTWRTYSNESQQTMGVTDGAVTVYPDMVVRNEADGSLVMIGEVETASSVTTLEAEQWRQYGLMSDTFYLYVPEGSAGLARRVGRFAKVTGMRTYAVGRDGVIRISNV